MYKGVAEKKKSSKKRTVILGSVSLLLGIGAFLALATDVIAPEPIVNELSFDESVSDSEQAQISDAIDPLIEYEQNIAASIQTSTTTDKLSSVLGVYVPVMDAYAVQQRITSEQLVGTEIVVPDSLDQEIQSALASILSVTVTAKPVNNHVLELQPDEIAFIPIDQLNFRYKLLHFDDSYYLDDFISGAIFRQVSFDGDESNQVSNLTYNSLQTSNEIYTVNMTGVTALTRVMQRKLAQVGDPLYFSEFIGDFLSDADLTHISNEVSFLENCSYSNSSFCSPPEFIETLKASGVDLVELTGNHNNDRGAAANAATIELYENLGWETLGGGLNTEDAAAPVNISAEGSNITFLGYNYPDGPGVIASETAAGGNPYDRDQIIADIAAAKEASDFIIIGIQFWECYAYPDGYIEYPTCDVPIGQQESVFKDLIDLGADMVVGSSAHQPQTYEIYNDRPIYYGLGNLYFEQTSWPGTERSLILTHYFNAGELIQTKITPTVYDSALQTRLMTDEEAAFLLQRLSDAR